ncbi:MAG: M50 family metallopeptidase [Candidatus Pacebacteria bacterium]|nr:M50 family metallopeptidase [Candidatus Paceibacterota bacterium]
MLIAIIVIVGLSLLILGHEAGHFFAAKMFGLKVDEFGFGFPPRIAAKKIGDTEYSLNWLPFGGFVRISGERGEFAVIDGEEGAPVSPVADPKRLFYSQPAWKKSIIVLAGVITNFILGWLFISIVLMVGVPQTLVIAGTQPGSPAAAAGIQSGDIVRGYTDSQSFIDFINGNKGTPVTVSVVRNNKDLSFTVTPRTVTAPNEGAIGVELQQGGAARENVFVALRDGFVDAAIVSWLTIKAFGDLVRQIFVHASIPADVVGPVGIFSLAEETGHIGLTYLLQFIGIISLNLMVVNLIPFPALDGGRFVMVLIEKVKKTPLSFNVEAWVNGIGFGLLLLLMLLLTIRDVHGLL